MIPSIRYLSYEERIRKLISHSREMHRVRDVIQVYKRMSENVSKILRISSHERTRNKGFKLDIFRFDKETGKQWFRNSVSDK